MWYLVFSILCSVTVSVFLKVAYRRHWQVSQAIATNYLMASALTLVLLRPQLSQLTHGQTPYFVLLALGLLLPSIFVVMALAVRHAGIIRSDAAQRLSLLIPLLAAFLFFGEAFDGWKLGGIVCGLVAILCLTISRPAPVPAAAPAQATVSAQAAAPAPAATSASKSQAFAASVPATPQGSTPPAIRQKSGAKITALLLFGVWMGYGLIDVLFKQLAQAGLAFTNSLIISFVLAGLLMLAGLLCTRTRWDAPSLLAGLLLGLFNFGNIYFYVRAHQQFPANPALVFAAMNIGVISLGTIAGLSLFGERINRWIALGLLLSLGAIVLLLP